MIPTAPVAPHFPFCLCAMLRLRTISETGCALHADRRMLMCILDDEEASRNLAESVYEADLSPHCPRLRELGGPDSNAARAALLIGAKAIAHHWFGDEKYARKIFYLSKLNGRRRPPFHYIGSRIALRVDALETWLRDQEKP